jgi:hypothetical protein
MTGANLPPRNVISFRGARTMRGPMPRYLAGRRSCRTFGGSTVWSSTEMIFGKAVPVPVTEASMPVEAAPI